MQFFRLIAAVVEQQDNNQIAGQEVAGLSEPQLLDASLLGHVSGAAEPIRAPGTGW